MAERVHDFLGAPHALRTIPGFYAPRPGIQIGCSIAHDATDDHLQLLQQLGVDWAHINVNDAALHNVEGYVGLKKRCAQYGLQVYRIAKHDVHNQPEITLGLPGRDEKIQDLCDFITNIGAAGIHYHTYAHMATGIWSSGRTEGRGGLTARKFDPDTAVGSWDGKEFPNDGMVHGRPYSEEELWEHYTYFIKRLAPVAEAAGVYIGIHPDDPPFYSLGGVPRCIFGTFEGYKRAMEIAVSAAALFASSEASKEGCFAGLSQHRRLPVPGLLARRRLGAYGRRRPHRHPHIRRHGQALQGPFPQRLEPDGHLRAGGPRRHGHPRRRPVAGVPARRRL